MQMLSLKTNWTWIDTCKWNIKRTAESYKVTDMSTQLNQLVSSLCSNGLFKSSSYTGISEEWNNGPDWCKNIMLWNRNFTLLLNESKKYNVFALHMDKTFSTAFCFININV